MGIAMTLHDYLDEMDVAYGVVDHPRRYTSLGIAHEAHVPAERLAKGVLVRGANGVLTLTVVPSDRMVDLDRLGRKLPGPLMLASEDEIARVFDDCDSGAVPPVGNAYAVRVMLDERLGGDADVYFEAGDHEELIRVSGDEFLRLMGGAEQGSFSRTL
ncbi:MAG: hypothetical protein COW30_18360 [Rhodospirillales bacterium CG15_BIG_FIL_POST_REV_8_21_14_020_66_15]|nr:MAG: hypothetical protein COW30_18360 [Rhodospirillales bacterium CG15_BIG_FIL_POST_REV_8_21_14_020_66_15]